MSNFVFCQGQHGAIRQGRRFPSKESTGAARYYYPPFNQNYENPNNIYHQLLRLRFWLVEFCPGNLPMLRPKQPHFSEHRNFRYSWRRRGLERRQCG